MQQQAFGYNCSLLGVTLFIGKGKSCDLYQSRVLNYILPLFPAVVGS